MPRRNAYKETGRPVGRQKRSASSMTDRQRLWLGVLVAYCQLRETGIFVGTPTTTGSIKINLYPATDDKCVGSLSLMDNFAEVVPDLLTDVFEEEIDIPALERAVPWLAVAASGVAPDKKPRLRSSEEVEVPPRPAQ